MRVDRSREVIFEWFAENKLTINNSKTQSLIFSLRHLSIDINNEPVKYLGIHLDPGLTWEEHVSHVVSRLNTSIFLIRNLMNLVCIDTVYSAYFACFYSHMSYGILCWGHSSHAALVFRAQRRCIRVMTRLGFTECCREKFKELRIMTFPSIYILHCLTHIRQNIHLYNRNLDNHQYNTRNREKLLPVYTRTGRARDGVNYYGIQFFNVLPSHIQSLPLREFKNAVKSYLLTKAFYSAGEFLSEDWTHE